MRVNTNMNAMVAHSNMTKNTALSGNSMEKISSGLRITKAGDDAAGLAISEKMRSQIRGLDQAGRNTQDGISMAQTAEGAMEETGNILQRMRELTVQAGNETMKTEDKEKIQEEIKQLQAEINNISERTEFNGKKLLNAEAAVVDPAGVNKEMTDVGSGVSNIKMSGFTSTNTTTPTMELAFDNTTSAGVQHLLKLTIDGKTATVDLGAATTMKGEVNFDFGNGKTVSMQLDKDLTTIVAGSEMTQDFTVGAGKQTISIQTGANKSQTSDIELENMSAAHLGVNTVDVTIDTTDNNLQKIDDALSKVSTARATLGAQQNRLEYTNNNLTTSSENLTAAESRIRDVDVAKEMMNLSKLNILSQAAQAMMGQAKQQPEGVLQLLR